MTRRILPIIFLVISLVAFGFDLYHFTHHAGHDPELLSLPAFWPKLLWKGGLLVLMLLLLIFSLGRTGFPVFVLGVSLVFGEALVFAAMTRESCERAREYMKESGLARDAKEDFLGRLKITPPRASFPPEMDKVTWWGRFQPFEFWESPEFQAVWINPRGEAVDQQTFRGGRCELAKTTLPVGKLPRARLEPGMWRVIVTCQDVTVDNHPFAVVGSSTPGPDSGAGEDSGVMIWADDIHQ